MNQEQAIIILQQAADKGRQAGIYSFPELEKIIQAVKVSNDIINKLKEPKTGIADAVNDTNVALPKQD